MTSGRIRWRPWLLLAVTALAAATQFGLPLFRPSAALIFLLLCPGAALIGLLRLKSGVTDWVLSLALSLVLVTLVAQLSLLPGSWSLEGAFWLLVALSTVGFATQLLQARSRSSSRR